MSGRLPFAHVIDFTLRCNPQCNGFARDSALTSSDSINPKISPPKINPTHTPCRAWVPVEQTAPKVWRGVAPACAT